MKWKWKLAAVFVILFAFAFAGGADAEEEGPNTWYVRQGGTGGGKSWADATGDLYGGLNSGCVGSGDQVWVAAGEYAPPQQVENDAKISAISPNSYFKLSPGVKLYGGFPAADSPDMGDRDWVKNKTILSGDNTSYHVVLCSSDKTGVPTPDNTRIDGFVITGGKAAAPSSGPSQKDANVGGGMYIRHASPTVENCTFIGNTAVWGGGMYNQSASPAVVNCTFTSNKAENGAGIVNFYNSKPIIVNSTFSGNVASADGGGMHNIVSSPTVANTIFWGNKAGSVTSGDEIFQSGDVATLKNCVVAPNGTGTRGGTITSSDLVRTNPKLVSGKADEMYIYKVEPGSPAVGKGLKVGATVSGDVKVPARDQMNKLRATTIGVTIGSYEGEAGRITPVVPILPEGTSTDIIPAEPFYAADPGKVSFKDDIFTDQLITNKDGEVVLSRDVVKAAGRGGGLSFDNCVDIPIFTATSSDAKGKLFAIGFKLKGADLFAESADKVRVQKILTPTTSAPFKYAGKPADFADKTFTVLTGDDSGKIFTGEIASADMYELVLFIRDSGGFDLDKDVPSSVTDPTVILDNPTDTRKSSGGCSATYAPFAILLALPLFFIRKRK